VAVLPSGVPRDFLSEVFGLSAIVLVVAVAPLLQLKLLAARARHQRKTVADLGNCWKVQSHFTEKIEVLLLLLHWTRAAKQAMKGDI
jgi:hypothetical protein